MHDMTPEQAPQIHDIESYRAVTGAKRFRRTKEESALGLTPQGALEQRLNEVRDPNQTQGYLAVIEGQVAKSYGKCPQGGEIVIRIKSAPGVDPDFFEHTPREEIQIELDNGWYGCYDELATCRYEDKLMLLFKHVLDLGIGEVNSTYHEEDEQTNKC